MSNNINCPNCNSSRTLNPEWERIWEYFDKQGQFDMNTCCRKADAEAEKYICTICNETTA